MTAWKDCKLGVLPYKYVHDIDEGFVPISSSGTVLLPGDTATAEADGFPLIIAISGKIIIAAHSSRLGVISSVIEMFERRGVRPHNISMFFLLYSREDIVKEFVLEAKAEGILSTLVTKPLAEFLTLNRIPYWEKSFIVLQMPQPTLLRLPKL